MDIPLPDNAQIRRDGQLGTITFLKGDDLSAQVSASEEYRTAVQRNDYAVAALLFMAFHENEFRLLDAAEEFVPLSTQKDPQGNTHVKLGQVYKGLPVHASELIVHFDPRDRIYLVNGRYIPTPTEVSTEPGIQVEAAQKVAAHSIQSSCANCDSRLVVLPQATKNPRLAWEVTARPSILKGWLVFVDAHSGSVLNTLSLVQSK